MDTNILLDTFGKEFIEKVRDLTIHQYLAIKSGKMKSQQAISTTKLITAFNIEDQKNLDLIVFEIIDRILHFTLFMFEESNHFTIVDKNENTNIVEISDGLCGELYGDEGWINKYSTYPMSNIAK